MISYRKYKLKRIAQTFILDVQSKLKRIHPWGESKLPDLYEAEDAEIAEHALSAIDIIDTRVPVADFLTRLLDEITEIQEKVSRPDKVDLVSAERLLTDCDLRFRDGWYYQIVLPEPLFRKFDATIPPNSD